MAKIDGSKLKSGALGKEVASSLAEGSSAVLIVGVVEEIISKSKSYIRDERIIHYLINSFGQQSSKKGIFHSSFF